MLDLCVPPLFPFTSYAAPSPVLFTNHDDPGPKLWLFINRWLRPTTKSPAIQLPRVADIDSIASTTELTFHPVLELRVYRMLVFSPLNVFQHSPSPAPSQSRTTDPLLSPVPFLPSSVTSPDALIPLDHNVRVSARVDRFGGRHEARWRASSSEQPRPSSAGRRSG
jgi:hypothetical protein